MKKFVFSILAFAVTFASITMLPLASVNAVETTSSEYEIKYDASDRVIVSLGDSYSAGEGIDNFYDYDLPISERVKSQDWLSHRSQNSWPGKLTLKDSAGNTIVMKENRDYYDHEGNHREGKWFFAAMSGAVTYDITNSTIKKFSKKENGLFSKTIKNSDEATGEISPQIDIFKQLGNKKVDYVTMTMGGNDIDFVDVVTKAAINVPFLEYASMDPNLMAYQPISKAILGSKLNDMVINVLPDTLKRLEEKYKTIAEVAGSQAHIVVAGYPKIISIDSKNPVFTKTDAEMIAEKITYFNNSLYENVRKSQKNGINISFVYVDGEDQFGNHGAYSPNGEYVYGLTLTSVWGSQEITDTPLSGKSFHPNPDGVATYARCVQSEIDRIENDKTRVWGHVVDNNNNPISEVKVTLTDDNNEVNIINISDSNGNYGIELDYKEGRHYTVKFESDGYEPLVVKEEKGGNRITINAKLKALYHISGTITDENNNLINDVTITLTDSDGNNCGTIKGNGSYSFGIKEENKTYTLTFEKEGYVTQAKTIIYVAEDRTVDVKLKREENIPDDVTVFNGHSYHVYSKFTWEEAEAYCESVGGHLVTITSQEEMNFIINELMNNTTNENCYWIGLQRNGDSWKWITGEEFSYQNWAENEPNNYENKNENYVHLFGKEYTEGNGTKIVGTWNDVTNDGASYAADFYDLSNFGYICEWDTVSSNSNRNMYAQYFTIEPIVSNYGPSIIDEYGVRLVVNDGAKIEKCAIYMEQIGETWYRTMAFVGNNITSAKYDPYVAYQGEIIYDGFNTNVINVRDLKVDKDDIWSIEGNYKKIEANLEDNNWNYLTLRSTSVVGNNVQIFDNLDKMREWLLSGKQQNGYKTVYSIPKDQIESTQNLNMVEWHPLEGLTATMMGLSTDETNIDISPDGTWTKSGNLLSRPMEIVNQSGTVLDAAGFVMNWVNNSQQITQLKVTTGKDKTIQIDYGSSFELSHSGKKTTLDQLLVDKYYNYSPSIIFSSSDKADELIRNWFGLTGDGKYSMELTFGRVYIGDFGYRLIVENNELYQVPIVHKDSSYKVYYKEKGKKAVFVLDAANILRCTRIKLPEDEKKKVLDKLSENGFEINMK